MVPEPFTKIRIKCPPPVPTTVTFSAERTTQHGQRELILNFLSALGAEGLCKEETCRTWESRRIEEGLSRSFLGCGREPWVPSTCVGDLRQLLRVPLRSQGHCGFGRGLSLLNWVWCNRRRPHLEWRQEPQGSSPFLTRVAEYPPSTDKRVTPDLLWRNGSPLSLRKILPAEAPPDLGTPCIFSPLHFFTFAGINQASLLYSIEMTVWLTPLHAHPFPLPTTILSPKKPLILISCPWISHIHILSSPLPPLSIVNLEHKNSRVPGLFTTKLLVVL